jgi:hypothetical protein
MLFYGSKICHIYKILKLYGTVSEVYNVKYFSKVQWSVTVGKFLYGRFLFLWSLKYTKDDTNTVWGKEVVVHYVFFDENQGYLLTFNYFLIYSLFNKTVTEQVQVVVTF